MSQDATADAVRAAIDARFTTPRVYEADEAAAATKSHIVIYVMRRYVPDQLVSGEVTVPGGRLLTRYVAKTVDDLRVMRERTTAALEDQILPGDVGPFTFETDEALDDEGGWFTAADTWTF